MRMNQTIAGIGKTENVLTNLIERDIQLLRSNLESISLEDFNKAVQLILKAKEIFVIGFSSSFALAYFIQFRLVRLGKRVHWIILTGGTALAEQLAYMKSDDLLIAIGFLRAPLETQTAMDHARKVGAPTLGLYRFANDADCQESRYLVAGSTGFSHHS